ncbi:MAG: thiamine phosphate synthase [Candidatus Hydrothermarchaeaceae archaeon]
MFDIYIITSPDGALPEPEFAREVIKGGAGVIQYREKRKEIALQTAEKLRQVTEEKGVLLIINDWVDIAKEVNADGVHLGQGDMSISNARKILGKDKIIGKSTHTLEQAIEAEKEGADYIGVGPIFATKTKPCAPVGLELIKKVKNKVRIPFVAIGGINEENIDEVIRAGAKSVAVVSAVAYSKDAAKKVSVLREKLRGNKNAV